jgi:hypothetical protein
MAFLHRTSLLLLTIGAAWTWSPAFAAAQAGTTEGSVGTAENFRKEPNGQILARLQPGTPVSIVGHRGKWLEAVVEGWVWSRSLQVVKREGFDLVVSASGGENLRREPSGDVLGHLARGMLLHQVEQSPGWLRVRRQGWIWAPSVKELARAASGGAAGSARTGQPTAPSSRSAATRPGRVTSAGTGGAAILSAPGGDTVGRATAGTELEVVTRQGDWARVRLEGWTWLPRDDSTAPSTDSTQVLTPADLARRPQAFRGRMVSWELQFISLEHAEKVRTDFFEGEPFLLTRFGGSAGPFVYVAVPTTRVDEMRGLIPLERIKVTGRVRTGASSLTGAPIIDLVSLERTGKSP